MNRKRKAKRKKGKARRKAHAARREVTGEPAVEILAPPNDSAPETAAESNEDQAPADTVGAQKNVAFYSAVANGWIATRMELDKTLLTLSAGGLGLFLTLSTTIGARSIPELFFYGVGSVSFAVSIASCLAIFHRNGNFLETLAKARSESGDRTLAKLDLALKIAFSVGALSAILAGSAAALTKYQEFSDSQHSERTMTTDKKQTGNETGGGSSAGSSGSSENKSLQESVNGMQKLRPNAMKTDTGSLNYLQRLQPKPVVPTPVPNPPASTNPPESTSKKE